MLESLNAASRESNESGATKSRTPEFHEHKDIMMTKKNAKILAKELVKEAYRKSKSKTCLTPFGERINKSNMKKDGEVVRWKGGKPDDI